MKKHKSLAKATIVFNAILLAIAVLGLPGVLSIGGSIAITTLFLLAMMSTSSILAIALATKYLKEDYNV